MLVPPAPADEDRRLEALHGLGILDTSPEPWFDRITRLACIAINVPIAVICFVDAHRQWFKSRQGLNAVETSREISFCGHAILREEPLIIGDARNDLRFADNPLVTGEPYARFYAGYPIHAPEGARVGTLCVIDMQPRQLSREELGVLADLAALIDAELSASRFSIAARTARIGLHVRSANSDELWWSHAMWDIFGQDVSTYRPSLKGWLALVHPEDRERVQSDIGASGKAGIAAALQYRIIRPDGAVRHLQSIDSATESANASGARIAGITLDVTERADAQLIEHGLQQKLRASSHLAGMAEIATGLMHSVGNVVNSMGIANDTIRRGLKALRVEQLEEATSLVFVNRATLSSFFTEDEHGKHLPYYLSALSGEISSKVQAVQAELDTNDALLGHLRDIVSAVQVHAQVGGRREPISLTQLIDAVLVAQGLESSNIEVVRGYEDVPLVTTDRHKLILILVNLLKNARDAVLAGATQPGRITVQVTREGDDAVIRIEDSGVGMSASTLSSLWRFGFTTKPNGKGFDLHNSANAAREIGGTITADSNGLSQGSRFIVRLPIEQMHAVPADRVDC